MEGRFNSVIYPNTLSASASDLSWSHDCVLWIAYRSNLKRGPYGSEDDFAIPPPAKLTRIDEPKRGALLYISQWEFEIQSEFWVCQKHKLLTQILCIHWVFFHQTNAWLEPDSEQRGSGGPQGRVHLGSCVLSLTGPLFLFDQHLWLVSLHALMNELPPFFLFLPHSWLGVSAAVRAEGVRRSLWCPHAQDSIVERLDGSCK